MSKNRVLLDAPGVVERYGSLPAGALFRLTEPAVVGHRVRFPGSTVTFDDVFIKLSTGSCARLADGGVYGHEDQTPVVSLKAGERLTLEVEG